MTNIKDTSGEGTHEVNDLLQKKEFGRELKAAREKSGLSPEEVAQSLLISVDIIKLIEKSQAEALPALAFTQGYIRSYARLVGVNADEIIESYMHMMPGIDEVSLPHSALPIQKSSNDVLVKFISLSFVVVAFFVLIFWLSKTDFSMHTEKQQAPAEFNLPVKAQLHETPAVKILAKRQSMNTEVAALETQKTINLPAKKKSVVPPVSVKKADPQTSVDVAKNKQAIDQLTLSALNQSWCEIQDATGKRLFYQLLNRGQDVTLAGVAPFTVFLGNAPQVRVEINNKIVDFENLINTNSRIASLEISQDAAVVRLSNR